MNFLKKAKRMENKIEIYQKNNKTQVEVRFENETIWLSQKQMAELFEKDIRTINEHIKTIYKTKELTKDSTFRKFRIVQQEGKKINNKHFKQE